MNILNCGCNLIETEIRLLSKYPNLKISSLTNSNKFKKKINMKIKNLKYEKNINVNYTTFENIKIRFDEIKFDRVIFIESLSYSKNIYQILLDCNKILNKNGKIYIRIITAPNTESSFVKENIRDMQDKLQCNLVYHENMIHFLQKAKYKNIKFSSIPLILSSNYLDPLFYISLLRYKLLNFGNMFSTLSLSETMYIADK